MSFSALSSDLVLMMAECMEDEQVNVLARTCRTLYRQLNPFLYHRDMKRESSVGLAWALFEMRAATLKIYLDAGVDIHAAMLPESYEGEWMPPTRQSLIHAAARWLSLPASNSRAVAKDHLSAIRLLLERGAKLSRDDAENLLVVATREYPVEAHPDRVNLARLICQYWNFSHDQDEHSFHRVIQSAAYRGSVEILRLLLDQGPPSFEYRRVLRITTERDDVERTQLLLEKGANDNGRDHMGFTLLYYLFASEYRTRLQGGQGVPPIIRLLVDHGANLDDGLESECPLLLKVVLCANDDLTSYFARSGADFVTPDSNGETLLHKAARNCEAASVALKLAELGVNTQAVNSEGNTALHYSVTSSQSTKEMAALLRLPVDVNAINSEGQSALHIVAESSQISTSRAEMLVEAGADINARSTSDGSTALHVAVRVKNIHLVRSLLSLGANADIQDDDGETPLDVARGLKKVGKIMMKEDLVNLLLANRKGDGENSEVIAAGKSKKQD